jgi:IS1 family transposase
MGKSRPIMGVDAPPTKKQPQPGWQYLQVVKQRENGRVIGTETRTIFGNEATSAVLGEHTAYVERTNLTTRHMTGRLVRKTLGFSKRRQMLAAACIWEDVVYNSSFA